MRCSARVIKYLGSKRLLLPRIVAAVESLRESSKEPVRTVLDVFSGTSRVGHALKRAGFRVVANDHNAYAHVLARAYVATDREDVIERAAPLLEELQRVRRRAGWFTRTYGEESRYLHPRNAAKIEGIRERIARMKACGEIDDALEAVALASLLEASDRVDSTTGVQMAYLKSWAPRASNDLELRLPEVLPRVVDRASGSPLVCEAHALDALEAARTLEADVAYLDPPYNQHSYLGNYHVWETLVRWDRPETYGVAKKRVDVRARTSDFNSRRRAEAAFAALVCALRCRHLIVSFSDEGFLSREVLEGLLRERGTVDVVEIDYKRYVGAQIGIYNPEGRKVGSVSHLRNKELLYVVTGPAPAPRRASAANPRVRGGRATRKGRSTAAKTVSTLSSPRSTP